LRILGKVEAETVLLCKGFLVLPARLRNTAIGCGYREVLNCTVGKSMHYDCFFPFRISSVELTTFVHDGVML